MTLSIFIDRDFPHLCKTPTLTYNRPNTFFIKNTKEKLTVWAEICLFIRSIRCIRVSILFLSTNLSNVLTVWHSCFFIVLLSSNKSYYVDRILYILVYIFSSICPKRQQSFTFVCLTYLQRNYLYLWVRILIRQGALDATSCDKVRFCQILSVIGTPLFF
jgi:magnesium-transporting ATPase (P-type)